MSTLLIVILLAIAFFHCLYVVYYWQKTDSEFDFQNGESFNPTVGVVLCLRGANGQLVDCLQGLAKQSRGFQLYCVFDNELDPAVAVVESNSEHFLVRPILLFADEISGNRSLKCNSLLHALKKVDESLEVLAFIDADVQPDVNWLKDLITPLADERIAVSTGNRWFSNEPATLGNSVRQCWNAAAVVQMMIYRIAWGGSWAAKMDTIRESYLTEHLKSAFCEDTALNNIVGKRQVFRVNSLVALNNESASLADTVEFITRQLLTVRMYHRAWPLVLGHGVLVLLVNVFAILALLYFSAIGDWAAGRQIFAAMCYLQIVNVFSLYFVARRNEVFLSNRGISAKSITHRPLSFLGGVLVSQFVHPYCALKAMFLSRTRWAGVDYNINGNSIELVNYHPSRIVT